MSESHTVTFAFNDGNISNVPDSKFSSDEIDVQIERLTENLAVGRYQYQSDSMFGSSTEANGYVVFDEDTDLVAVTNVYDRPKAMVLFEALEEALDTTLEAPDLRPEDQHEVYKKYGFDAVNGYTISFKQNSKVFDYSYDMGRTLDPEDEAEDRCKHDSNLRMSDDLVREIAEDAMDRGMYIWTCDLYIEGYNIKFSDPIRFTGITTEFLEEHGFERLFEISRNCANLENKVF